MVSEAVQRYNRKKGRIEELSTTEKYIDMDNLRVINKMLERQTKHVNELLSNHKNLFNSATIIDRINGQSKLIQTLRDDAVIMNNQLQALSQLVGELRRDK